MDNQLENNNGDRSTAEALKASISGAGNIDRNGKPGPKPGSHHKPKEVSDKVGSPANVKVDNSANYYTAKAWAPVVSLYFNVQAKRRNFEEMRLDDDEQQLLGGALADIVAHVIKPDPRLACVFIFCLNLAGTVAGKELAWADEVKRRKAAAKNDKVS